MNSLLPKEMLLDAFTQHLRQHTTLSKTGINEYRLAAEQFVNFCQEQSQGRQWLDLVRNEQTRPDYINSEVSTLSVETRTKKEIAIQEFQGYARQNGWWVWLAAWIKNEQNRPFFFFVSLLISALVFINTPLPFLGWDPVAVKAQWFPSDTPTATNTSLPTNTATITLTLSPTLTLTSTLTLTPTLTPTPNATQSFLATQLPTANAGFVPQVRTANDSVEQVFVPGGSFLAGDQSGIGFDDEVVHQVYTDSFWIDRFLVTNAQFAKCPENICGQPESFVSHKRPNGYYGIPGFDNYPVIELTWSQAEAFCEWRGGRLPAEAEWEKAAGWDPVSGEMQIYPWGNQPPDKTLANYDNVDLDTTEVGFYSSNVSPIGAYDMAGNVWEWIFDWYADYDPNQQINPMGPPSGEKKVIRGGSWANTTNPQYLRVANRGTDFPGNATNETGFRCVFVVL
jgi:formylglycine-generating enzyme required for sulfatase activity